MDLGQTRLEVALKTAAPPVFSGTKKSKIYNRLSIRIFGSPMARSRVSNLLFEPPEVKFGNGELCVKFKAMAGEVSSVGSF